MQLPKAILVMIYVYSIRVQVV